MKKELVAIRKRYLELWAQLRPGEKSYELDTAPRGDGVHVEFEDGEYRYIVSDRGAYVHLQKTDDSDELAYWLAMDLMQPLLCHIKGQRPTLERQAELLGQIDPAWEARRRKEIKRILARRKRN